MTPANREHELDQSAHDPTITTKPKHTETYLAETQPTKPGDALPVAVRLPVLLNRGGDVALEHGNVSACLACDGAGLVEGDPIDDSECNDIVECETCDGAGEI